jgi:hypothetical protein
MTAAGVRRDKAALSNGYKAPPGDSLQPEVTGAGMEEKPRAGIHPDRNRRHGQDASTQIQ